MKTKVQITRILTPMVNSTYSDTWFDIFLSRGNERQTSKEIQFILSQIQIGIDNKILDIACGNGRHSRKLAAYGFEIFGIDTSEKMINEVKKLVPDGKFYLHDMRDLANFKEEKFDLILLMWQSFGHYEDQTNISILEAIYDLLGVEGKFIIDIYNKEFFLNHQGIRKFNRGGKTIEETKFVKNNRLQINLQYGHTTNSDDFNWRIYSLDEFIEIVQEIGFTIKTVCTNFDQSLGPTSEDPRIQYVLIKK